MTNLSKYTVEGFESWLNADKSRKRGLWLWSQVIAKVKSDSDLFASLATGQDQGGWNISDPQFRKDYKFEDYYQVFQEWKEEVDAEETNNGKEEEDEEQENKQEEIKETCPHCQGNLTVNDQQASCNDCHKEFQKNNDVWEEKTDRKNNPKEKKAKNNYDILGIKANASEEEIKKAYKRMSLKYQNGLTTEDATEKFQELHTAYEELTQQAQKQVRRKKFSSQMGIMAIFIIVGLLIVYLWKRYFSVK